MDLIIGRFLTPVKLLGDDGERPSWVTRPAAIVAAMRPGTTVPGSLAAAARRVGWSYRHAWGYVRRSDDDSACDFWRLVMAEAVSPAQTFRYIDEREACDQRLADNPASRRPCDHVRVGLRRTERIRSRRS